MRGRNREWQKDRKLEKLGTPVGHFSQPPTSCKEHDGVIMICTFADLGSIAATIMYAFYLNETLESDQLCTVPVINMKREDLSSHAEMKWLLDSCQIDESSLIFVDEVYSFGLK